MTKNSPISIACFGEILFDVFPNHKKIGGAPLNVAFRLNSLGITTSIISRIGKDELGKEISFFLEENSIDTQNIQEDKEFATGSVLVALDEKGSASYTIKYPVAWDKISHSVEIENTVNKADALVFGSLASRDAVSLQTLLKLMKVSKYKIFDVNLRAPFYTKELLIDLMNQADFIKFNEEELLEICGFLESPFSTLDENISFISKQTNTNEICVTKGSIGAVLLYEGNLFYNDGFSVTVADTVGSGDSFLAGLLSQLLTTKNPQKALDFACALGAIVATKEGANPKITTSEMEVLIQNKYIL